MARRPALAAAQLFRQALDAPASRVAGAPRTGVAARGATAARDVALAAARRDRHADGPRERQLHRRDAAQAARRLTGPRARPPPAPPSSGACSRDAACRSPACGSSTARASRSLDRLTPRRRSSAILAASWHDPDIRPALVRLAAGRRRRAARSRTGCDARPRAATCARRPERPTTASALVRLRRAAATPSPSSRTAAPVSTAVRRRTRAQDRFADGCLAAQ